MILELCKGVHCVDLDESFQTHIYLQNLASLQPRTSPLKSEPAWAAPARPDFLAGRPAPPSRPSVGKNFKHPFLGDECCFTISFANVNEAIDRQQRLETGKNFRCLKKIPRHRVCAQNIDIFSKFDINLSTLVIILQSSAKTHQIADILTDLLLAFCVWSGAKDRKSCRARQML